MVLRRLAGGVTLVAALALNVIGWLSVHRAEPATGPTRMTWARADGTPPDDPPGDPYPFDGCGAIDIELTIATWRGIAIAPCDDEALGAGYVALDPRTRRAELRWPVAGEIARTLGLAPGPDGQLAIVYELDLHGPLWVGIADERGWRIAPHELAHRLYRAGAWVDGTFELVSAPNNADDQFGMHTGLVITRVTSTGRDERVLLAPCPDDSCYRRTFAYRRDGTWLHDGGGHSIEYGEVDRLAQGVLDTPTDLALGYESQRTSTDGHVAVVPAVPADRVVFSVKHYIITTRVERTPIWTLDRNYVTRGERVAGREILMATDGYDQVWVADRAVELLARRPVGGIL